MTVKWFKTPFKHKRHRGLDQQFCCAYFRYSPMTGNNDWGQMIDEFKVKPMDTKGIEHNGICRRNTNEIVFTHLNINSLINKFDSLIQQV